MSKPEKIELGSIKYRDMRCWEGFNVTVIFKDGRKYIGVLARSFRKYFILTDAVGYSKPECPAFLTSQVKWIDHTRRVV